MSAGKFGIEDYRPAEVITLDIETSGLDPHTDQRLLQNHHLARLTVVTGF